MYSHQKLGSDAKIDDATHSPRGYERYIPYIMRFPGKSKEAIKHSKNGLRKPSERESGLAFL